jgi:hypothetical protein
VRLAAELLLTRRCVDAWIDYLLCNYNGSGSGGAATWTAQLGDLLRGPTDFVLWTKCNMALTTSATQASTLNWITWFGRDAPQYALPVPYVAEHMRNASALAVLHDCMLQADAVWELRSSMSIQAHAHFSHAYARDVWRTLYPRAYVVLCFVTALVDALRKHVPPEHELVEAAALRQVVDAALGPGARLPPFYGKLREMVVEGTQTSLELLATKLAAGRDSMYQLVVRPTFVAIRDRAPDASYEQCVERLTDCERYIA